MSVQISGVTTGQAADVDAASRALRVTLYDINGNHVGPANSYDATAPPFTPGTTPQDVFVIQGSNSKTIKVTRIHRASTQTTAGINTWYLLRRTGSAYSAGTASALVPRDTNSPAATATVQYYVNNPATSGSLVGTIRVGNLMAPIKATGTTNDNLLWDFDDLQATPIYLRNVSQSLAVNFNGAALPAGLSVVPWVSWTEE